MDTASVTGVQAIGGFKLVANSTEKPIEEVGQNTVKLVVAGMNFSVGSATTEMLMALEFAVAPEVVIVRAERT